MRFDQKSVCASFRFVTLAIENIFLVLLSYKSISRDYFWVLIHNPNLFLPTITLPLTLNNYGQHFAKETFSYDEHLKS